jgi:alpha-beta hydrolase superfamily lysophospholipase
MNDRAPSAVPLDAAASDGMITFARARDGHRIAYRVWSGAASHATLVLSNGLVSHSAWLAPIAARMSRRGLRVVGADRRGSGLDPIGRGDLGEARTLVNDLESVIEREASGPLFVGGWCWGAIPAILAALELGPRASGLVLLAPGLFPSQAIQTAARALESSGRALAPDSASLRSPIEDEHFTDGPFLDRFIRRDPHRLRTVSPRLLEVVKRLGFEALRALPRLEIPVLALLAAKDRTADNAATARGLFRLVRTGVRIVTCDCQHAIQFEAPQEATEAIVSWIEEQVHQPADAPASRSEAK